MRTCVSVASETSNNGFTQSWVFLKHFLLGPALRRFAQLEGPLIVGLESSIPALLESTVERAPLQIFKNVKVSKLKLADGSIEILNLADHQNFLHQQRVGEPIHALSLGQGRHKWFCCTKKLFLNSIVLGRRQPMRNSHSFKGKPGLDEKGERRI